MDRQVPGSGPVNAAYQAASSPADAMDRTQAPPSTPSAAGEPNPQQQETPPVDFEARLREEQSRREAAEAERIRLQQTLGEVQQGLAQQAAQAQAQQRRQQLEQRWQGALQRSASMRQDEAERFLRDEFLSIQSEQDQERQRELQQREQQQMQTLRKVVYPQYVDDLAKRMGLPEEAKRELLDYDDPEVAYRQAPHIKRRYDEMAQLQQRLDQLARDQQARQMQGSGVTNLGGYNGAQSGGLEVPDNLTGDDRALWIYRNGG